MQQPRTGGIDHHNEDHGEHQSRAEVGFDYNQSCKPCGDQAARNECSPEVGLFTSAFFEVVSEENYESDFRYLRWLNREAWKFNPAVRTVDLAKRENRHERDRRYEQQTVDDCLALELLIVELHREQHHDKTNGDPYSLFEDVIELAATLVLRHDGGSAIDHDDAEQRQSDRRCEKP